MDSDNKPIRDKDQCCVYKCEQAKHDKIPSTCVTTAQFWHPDDTIKDCNELCGSDNVQCHKDKQMIDCSGSECLIQQCLNEFKKNGLAEGSICDNKANFHESLRAMCELAIDFTSGINGVSVNPDQTPVRDKAKCCDIHCELNDIGSIPLTCSTADQFWHPDDSITECKQFCGSFNVQCHKEA